MTKPMAGVPYHPEVTKVVFETTATPDETPADLYARRFLARTVGHLQRVDVERLVLEHLLQDPEFHSWDYRELEHRRAFARLLVTSVLDEARATLRNRLAVDVAASLLPRLKENRS